MPSCARCHAATGVDDRYCMACGHRLGTSPQPATVDDDRTETSLPAIRVPEPEPGLVACPACGGSNAGRRRRCARCGAGLRPDGALLLDDRPADGAQDAAGQDAAWEDAGDRRATRVAARRGPGAVTAVVGFGILVGALVGAAAGMGLGPFASVEAVPFDADAYPTDPQPLRPATAGSSSTANPTADRAFGPELTVDGDLATAWRTEGAGRGTRLRHAFVEPVWLDRIEVAVGDQAGDDTFRQTGQPTEATIDLGTQRVEVVLAPEPGVQLVSLPEPVLVDQVTWELTRTVGGRTVAISEVAYVGWQADDADKEAFRDRS